VLKLFKEYDKLKTTGLPVEDLIKLLNDLS